MLRTVFHASSWQDLPWSEIRRLIEAAGLDGVVLDASSLSQNAPAHPNIGELIPIAALRVESLAAEACATTTTLAAQLGAGMIIVRPQSVLPPDLFDRATWRGFGEHATRNGQTIAVDFGASEEFDTRAMLHFVQAVAQERVRLCFDLGAYACRHLYSHWEVALQRVIADVAVLWLSETTGTPGDLTRPPLGEGTIDFFRVAQIVRSMRLDLLAVIDVPPPRPLHAAQAEELAKALSQSVAHLRRCGWFDP